MPNKSDTLHEAGLQRIRLTIQLTLAAYDAISEIQRNHRRKTGKVLRAWEVIDQAVRTYAEKHGIQLREE